MSTPSLLFTHRRRFGETEQGASETHMLDLNGRIALRLVEHFGVIAGFPDGEDSAGRSKLGLLPPEKVVQRACEIAGLFIAEVQHRGWLHEVPAQIAPEAKQPEDA